MAQSGNTGKCPCSKSKISSLRFTRNKVQILATTLPAGPGPVQAGGPGGRGADGAPAGSGCLAGAALRQLPPQGQGGGARAALAAGHSLRHSEPQVPAAPLRVQCPAHYRVNTLNSSTVVCSTDYPAKIHQMIKIQNTNMLTVDAMSP